MHDKSIFFAEMQNSLNLNFKIEQNFSDNIPVRDTYFRNYFRFIGFKYSIQ